MNHGTVLVVDDEQMIRAAIAEGLTSSGYNCQAASDGQEALDLLRYNSFDIIISDIRMPRIDGLELMIKAREIRPGTSFIIITGYALDYPFDEIIEVLHLLGGAHKVSEVILLLHLQPEVITFFVDFSVVL